MVCAKEKKIYDTISSTYEIRAHMILPDQVSVQIWDENE